MCHQGRGYAPTLEQSNRIKTDEPSDMLSDLISNPIQSRDMDNLVSQFIERERDIQRLEGSGLIQGFGSTADPMFLKSYIGE